MTQIDILRRSTSINFRSVSLFLFSAGVAKPSNFSDVGKISVEWTKMWEHMKDNSLVKNQA